MILPWGAIHSLPLGRYPRLCRLRWWAWQWRNHLLRGMTDWERVAVETQNKLVDCQSANHEYRKALERLQKEAKNV